LPLLAWRAQQYHFGHFLAPTPISTAVSIVSYGFHRLVKDKVNEVVASSLTSQCAVWVLETAEEISRKEVMTMPVYKVTKVFVLDAPDKQSALAKVKDDQEALKYLEYVSIKEQAAQGGWGNTIKSQLLGSKK
jgi:hypothetical protein